MNEESIIDIEYEDHGFGGRRALEEYIESRVDLSPLKAIKGNIKRSKKQRAIFDGVIDEVKELFPEEMREHLAIADVRFDSGCDCIYFTVRYNEFPGVSDHGKLTNLILLIAEIDRRKVGDGRGALKIKIYGVAWEMEYLQMICGLPMRRCCTLREAIGEYRLREAERRRKIEEAADDAEKVITFMRESGIALNIGEAHQKLRRISDALRLVAPKGKIKEDGELNAAIFGPKEFKWCGTDYIKTYAPDFWERVDF